MGCAQPPPPPPPPSPPCDCNFHWGGCFISWPAPAGQACKCSYEGPLTHRCSGENWLCSDPNSPLCATPDSSVASCILGGGDCGGYSGASDCDCAYHSTGLFSGGCQISQAAPAYSACKCSMPFLITCGGDVVSCHDAANPLCASPDMSKASCQLGGGDCDGYSCTDTPNWSNGQHGWSCTGYESQGWCCGQGACPGQEWTLGATYNHPENNCAACNPSCTDTPNWSNGQHGWSCTD